MYIDEVNSIIDELCNGWLVKNQVEYLRPVDNPRPRIFYILPKNHKPVDKWFGSNKLPPGRSTVSDFSSDSYHISEFIDNFITPLPNRRPSYVKDSWEFCETLRDIEILSNAILVTANVRSFFTNIQLNKCFEALRKCMINMTLACHLTRLTGCWNSVYCTMLLCLTINGFSKLLVLPWPHNMHLVLPILSCLI